MRRASFGYSAALRTAKRFDKNDCSRGSPAYESHMMLPMMHAAVAFLIYARSLARSAPPCAFSNSFRRNLFPYSKNGTAVMKKNGAILAALRKRAKKRTLGAATRNGYARR